MRGWPPQTHSHIRPIPSKAVTMASRRFSPVASILLLLSILATMTSASAIYSPVNLSFLIPRQQQTNTTCSEYSTIANLSIVGANSTYRAAFLAASPQGGDPARAPLDTAEKELPDLQFDTALNTECGNLTEIAIKGAATNFTNGVVLQFMINSAVPLGASASGIAMIAGIVVVMVMEIL
ncbi:hypothetical protein EDD36DRAFT_219708 [Exophiala viscosa]|uniref:Uncharacterized protein n=1 Tax=Exophiala viscosa TaxID=2486360 RepID=A0AAN6IE92_9EURO|nr:hypothetical protein EDD36DRAFT_219708 [Exophiala viscosa]